MPNKLFILPRVVSLSEFDTVIACGRGVCPVEEAIAILPHPIQWV
ncbi:hypothetical protein [Calothrix sp. PCC 7507]|nr:hypothetical protein [Calothrix sp. PCC 7507]